MSYIPGFGYNGISTISAGDQRILYPSINKIFPYWEKKSSPKTTKAISSKHSSKNHVLLAFYKILMYKLSTLQGASIERQLAEVAIASENTAMHAKSYLRGKSSFVL